MTVKLNKFTASLLPAVMGMTLCHHAWAGTIEAVGYDRVENGQFIYTNNNALTAFPDSGVAAIDLDFASPEDITFRYTITDDDFDSPPPTITPGTISLDAILLNLSGTPWHSFNITLDGGATWGGINFIRPDDQDDNSPGDPPNGNFGPPGGINGPDLPTPFNVLSNPTQVTISFVNPIIDTGNPNTTGFEIGIPNQVITNDDWRINLNDLSVGDSFLVTFSPNDVVIPEPTSLAVFLVGLATLLRRRSDTR